MLMCNKDCYTVIISRRSIFDFYRTGKLQRPHDIPINVFIREVQFYEIQNEIIPEEYLKLPQSKIKVGFPRASKFQNFLWPYEYPNHKKRVKTLYKGQLGSNLCEKL